jgi:hypothetical protein
MRSDHGEASVTVQRSAMVSPRRGEENRSPSPSPAGAHRFVLPSLVLRSVSFRRSNSALKPDPAGVKGVTPQRTHRIFIGVGSVKTEMSVAP